MKHVVFRNLCMAVVSLFLVQGVSAQKWLKKVNEGLDALGGKTEQSAQTDSNQLADTIDAKAFLNNAPTFEVKKVTVLDEKGDTIRNDDGTIQYHYLVYDKEGKVCHPETAKKLTNAALKSGGLILLKVGGGAAAGSLFGALSGGKKGAKEGAVKGGLTGVVLSAGDMKNIKEKTKELKAYKAALEKYQATFTDEGLPRDAEADISDYADCGEMTQDMRDIEAQLEASKEQGKEIGSVDDEDLWKQIEENQ